MILICYHETVTKGYLSSQQENVIYFRHLHYSLCFSKINGKKPILVLFFPPFRNTKS